MEQQYASDDSRVSNQALWDAGASDEYVAYYEAAHELGKETASTRHAEKVVAGIIEYGGGGFHEALWEGEPRFAANDSNPYGADMTNMLILAEAGVPPYDDSRENINQNL
jgi:hypothetical protein